jgi:hypothetical protein
LVPERVTMRAEAIEMMKEGNWLVRPSPIVSLVKTSASASRVPASLDHADGEAARDVDGGDDDAGDGVAADELGGTVHGAEEVGFLGDLARAAAGFGLVDDAGVEVASRWPSACRASRRA